MSSPGTITIVTNENVSLIHVAYRVKMSDSSKTDNKITKFSLLKLICLTFAVLITANSYLFATNYYIDFDSGKDGNSGTSPVAAWKHGPGDSLATDNAKTVSLMPGDTIFFKGGVKYLSTFKPSVVNGSGTTVNSIVYKGDGWPVGEKAIIDGSEVITGWKKCESDAECFGHPKWKQIYYAVLTEDAEVLSSNVHLNNSPLTLAQYPNPNNAYEMNVILDDWYTVPSKNVSDTTIKDTTIKNLKDHSTDMYLGIHCFSSNSEIKKVTNISNDTVYFEKLSNEPVHEDTKYSVINSIDSVTFDQIGEYVIKKDRVTGKQIVYAMLSSSFNPEKDTVTFSKRGGLYIGNNDYITIEGFWIKKIVSRAIATSSNSNHFGCKIINNTIENIQSLMGTNLISVMSSNSIIRGNVIQNIGNMRGIMTAGRDVLIADNKLNNIDGTVIFASGCGNVRIINNYIENSVGSHSNGISTYGCKLVLVANNKVVNTPRPYTFEDSDSLCVFQNIFIGPSGYIVAQWDKNIGGYLKFINNIVISESGNAALLLNPSVEGEFYLINNIISGGGGDDFALRRNNIFTALSWYQNASYGWKLETGEMEAADYMLFASLTEYDMHHKAENKAIDAGFNPLEILEPDIVMFKNDFDFTKDIEGNQRAAAGVWDIGPYEYMHSDINSKLKRPVNLRLILNN